MKLQLKGTLHSQ